MTKCSWEKINNFQMRSEFDRFAAWMLEQVSLGVAEQVSVTHPYSGAPSFPEKWFRHIGSGEVWRLVWPDGPFHGLFERV